MEERAKQKAREVLSNEENFKRDVHPKAVASTTLKQQNDENGLMKKLSSHPTLSLDLRDSELNNGDVIDTPSSSWNQSNDEFSEHQQQLFKNWLNYILKPTTELQVEFQDATNVSTNVVNTTKQKILSENLEKARLNATALYNSQEFLYIRTALAAEISRGALSIRTDQDVFADISLRNQMIDLLLSYSPSWLRLGLETIFQEKLCIKDLLQSFHEKCKSRQLLGLLPLDSQKVL